MFNMIIDVIKKMFSGSSFSDELESYIVSRHPQNASDVERLERDFYNNISLRSRAYFTNK